jgi:hypothetical protein
MNGPFMTSGEAAEFGPVFGALFDGEDACCGRGIEQGDRIHSDGEGGWVHEECDDIMISRGAPRARPGSTVRKCTRCFCIHAGEC